MLYLVSGPNPYDKVKEKLVVNGQEHTYFSLPKLKDKRYGKTELNSKLVEQFSWLFKF